MTQPPPGQAGFGPIGEAASPEDDLQHWTRLLVRSGLLDDAALRAEVVSAVEAELPGIDAPVLAGAWIAGAQAELRRAAQAWDSPTDHERLVAAMVECGEHGVPVLLGVTPAEARAELERRTTPRGVAWCARDDVLDAIESRVLRLELRHPDGTLAAEGDALAGPVLACAQRHGLRTRLHEDRWEVAVRWQRRP